MDTTLGNLDRVKQLAIEVQDDWKRLIERRADAVEASAKLTESIEAGGGEDPATPYWLIVGLQEAIAIEALDHALTKKLLTLTTARLGLVTQHLTAISKDLGIDLGPDPFGLDVASQ
jgi:hypothetical protein